MADPAQQDLSEAGTQQFPDGVGDACDLRPSRGDDQRELFSAFATQAATETAWQLTGVRVDGDRVVADAAGTLALARARVGDGLIVRAFVPLASAAMDLALIVDAGPAAVGPRCRLTGSAETATLHADGPDVVPAELTFASDPTQPLILSAVRSIDINRVARLLCFVHQGGELARLETGLTDDLAIGSVLVTLPAGASLSALEVLTSPLLGDPVR